MGVMLLELELREIWGEEPARQRVSPVRCLSGLMTGGVWSHFELPSLPITFPRDKYEDLIDLQALTEAVAPRAPAAAAHVAAPGLHRVEGDGSERSG